MRMKKCYAWLLPFVFTLSCLPAGKNEGVGTTSGVRDQLQLTTLTGEQLDASDFEGKYLFVNFWATWCGPCVQEMPSIDSMAAHFGNDKLAILLISNEKPSRVTHFVETQAVKSPVYFMPNSLETFDIDGLPTTLLIDPRGDEIMRRTGAYRWNDPEVIAHLDSLLSNAK